MPLLNNGDHLSKTLTCADKECGEIVFNIVDETIMYFLAGKCVAKANHPFKGKPEELLEVLCKEDNLITRVFCEVLSSQEIAKLERYLPALYREYSDKKTPSAPLD